LSPENASDGNDLVLFVRPKVVTFGSDWAHPTNLFFLRSHRFPRLGLMVADGMCLLCPRGYFGENVKSE